MPNYWVCSPVFIQWYTVSLDTKRVIKEDFWGFSSSDSDHHQGGEDWKGEKGADE
jgi:hypothetical protein